MADKALTEFVHNALANGRSRDQISAVLAEAGWPPVQVANALAQYHETDFQPPVPRPSRYISAREAFLYLVLFILLGISASYLGILLFEIIDKVFPDPAESAFAARSADNTIRMAIAALVVAFPLFLAASVHLSGQRRKNPAMQRSRLRKWLTYLTLVVAAGFLVGDLISVIYHFLSGEMTARFALKAGVILAIAGVIFLYYVRDAERDEGAADD